MAVIRSLNRPARPLNGAAILEAKTKTGIGEGNVPKFGLVGGINLELLGNRNHTMFLYLALELNEYNCRTELAGI